MTRDSNNIAKLYQQNIILLEKDENQTADQEDSLLKDFLMFIAKVIDPTGILSWGDLKKAIQEADYSNTAKTFLSSLRILLTLYNCIPNFGLLIGAGAGAVAGAPALGVGAAPGAAVGGVGGGSIWAGIKAIAKILASPMALKAAGKYPKFMKVMQTVGAKASSFLRNGMFGETIQKALADAQTKGVLTQAEVQGVQKVIQFFAGGLTVGKGGLKVGPGNVLTAPALKKATRTGISGVNYLTPKLADTSTTPTISAPAQTPAQKQQTDMAVGRTTALPGGPTDTTPVAEPEPANPEDLATTAPQGPAIYRYDRATGRFVPTQTQREFGTTGGYGYRMIPGERKPTGVMSPANVPQGYTPQSPYGREGMSPYQIYKPNTFQYGPTSFIGAPTGGVGQIANLLGMGTQLAGSMGNSPVAGFANLATGLLGLLPGLQG